MILKKLLTTCLNIFCLTRRALLARTVVQECDYNVLCIAEEVSGGKY